MSDFNLSKKAVSGSLWNFSANIISRAGALIFSIILAKFLLPGRFGVYSLSLSIAMIFLTLGDLGINQTLIKYVSQSISKNKLSIAKAYFKYIIRMKFLLTIAVSLILVVFSFIAPRIFNNNELFFPLILSSIFIFLFSLETFFESIFYIYHKTFYLNIKELIYQMARIGLVLTTFILASRSYYVSGVIVSMIIAMFLALLFVIYYSMKLPSFVFDKRINSDDVAIDVREYWKFLLYLTLGGVAGIFFSYIDTIVIGLFLDAEFVGYYRAAYTLVFGIVGMLIFPQLLLTLFSESNKKKMSKNFNDIIKYLTIVVVPVFILMCFFSKEIILIVYGVNYLPSSLVLLTLSIMLPLSVYSSTIISLLSSKGRASIFASSIIWATIINIVLNFIIIYLLRSNPENAIVGAAVATVISSIFYNIRLISLSKSSIGLSYDISFFHKPIISGLVMASILLVISKYTDSTGVIYTLITSLIGVILYLSMIIATGGLEKKELFFFYHSIMGALKK